MYKLLFCLLISTVAVVNCEHVLARSLFSNGTRAVNFSPTRLSLGVYYQISCKGLSSGKNIATYINQDTVDGLHTELDTVNLADYNPGGIWDADGQWIIQSSEVNGYYTISVKRYPDTLLSVAVEKGESGNYVQLATSKNINQYKPGGSKRSNALWTFWTTTQTDYFYLTPLSNTNAYLTYTFAQTQYGRYLEVDPNNGNNYAPGGAWYESALFTFKEPSSTIINPGNMNLVNLQGLTAHNEYRSRHRNTAPLEYDEQLAAFAQDWANYLASKEIFQHRPNNNYGENLAYYSVGGTLGGDTASKMWYDEIAYYNFNTGTGSGVIGHFTQLVWASTKKVGFGRAVSSKGNIYVVANYYPPGNYVGQYLNNVFPLVSG